MEKVYSLACCRRISLIVPLVLFLSVLKQTGFDRPQLNCYPPPLDVA